jgi:NADPH:quinone reductase-like Zn-dependent oxidoreductase
VRAVVIHETGGPEVLHLEEVPDPELLDGEVLVRVRAVAVNPVDWKLRRGLMPRPLPTILGSDISGTVERSLAEGFSEGEEVFGFASSGAYAELAKARSDLLAHNPGHLSHEQAAALPVAALTAWQALFDVGGLRAEQTVLIAGAAGGVGHLAVQFARQADASVIGTGSQRNREFVIGLGAEVYVDYADEDVARVVRGEADVVLDCVGAETTATLVPCVRSGGVFITIAGPAPEQEAAALGFSARLMIMKPNAEQLERIGRLVADGVVQVEIAETMPLADIIRAHGRSESGRVRGKIILTV